MLQRRRSGRPASPSLDVYPGARTAQRDGRPPAAQGSSWVELRLRLFYAVLSVFSRR